MEIYRFRVYKGWYAYVSLGDAQDARQYFLDEGHPPDAIGEVEKSEDGCDFEFKMNPLPYRFNGKD
jgi:hypothetical protein